MFQANQTSPQAQVVLLNLASVVCREWLQFGIGAQGSTHIGAPIFTSINPTASVGLNFGSRKFKVSLQSTEMYFEKSVMPSANLSFQLLL